MKATNPGKEKKSVTGNEDLVLIEWCDAESNCTWEDMDDVVKWIEKGNFICREVGWVIEDNKKMIALTSQLGDNNLVGNRTKIPKPWIISKTVLRWPKNKIKPPDNEP